VVRTLAENVPALAASVPDINAGLRQRLALDSPESGAEVLDHRPEADAADEPNTPRGPRRNGKKG
jgi:hypothetical protein